MATFFQKLTHKEVRELQNTTQNILQSCQEGINSLDNISPNQKSSEYLFNELCNRNTIITQLANMTIFILEQISRCIQEKEELLEQNRVAYKKNETQNNNLMDAKEQIQQLILQNMEAFNKCQTLISERDFINERNQCLNAELQRQKHKAQIQRNKLCSQLEYLHLKVLNQDQKIKDNQYLQLKNQKLQEELKQIKKDLDLAVKELEESRRNLQKLNENPEDFSLKNSQQKENLQHIDDNVVLQQRSSNLKLELEENIQISNYKDLSKIRQVKQFEEKKEDNSIDIKQKNIQQNKPKLKRIISISRQSDVDIDLDESLDHFQHQSLNLQVNDESVQIGSVKNRIQTLHQNTEIQKISKNKQSNVSRIKFLMKNIGGTKEYAFKKKGKTERYKTQRSQDSRIQGEKLRNIVLDKKGAVETSTTETLHLSRRIFPKRSPC